MICYIYKSDSCKECYALECKLEAIKKMFSKISFEIVDVDENPQFIISKELLSLPALELYSDSKLIAEFKHGKYKSPEHVINFLRVYQTLGE